MFSIGVCLAGSMVCETAWLSCLVKAIRPSLVFLSLKAAVKVVELALFHR